VDIGLPYELEAEQIKALFAILERDTSILQFVAIITINKF
jgi:hypothetical protein